MFSFQSRVCLFLRKSRQNEGVRGMATLKSISMRLKSVKNIKKITQSMKMVSAAKLSRAERELKQAKPLGEGIKLFYKSIEPEGTPEDLSKKKVLYLAVTSDRGLCGAVHTSVAKIIRNELQDPGENIKIVCIGDKARALLQRSYADNFLFVCQEVGRVPPTFKDASRIVSEIFLSGFDFQIGKVVYNRFRSIVSYSTENVNFYDFGTIEEAPRMQTYTEVDGLEDDTLTSFIEFSMVALIFYAMKEGACSEQSSRMTAMDNSSKNAGDMIGKLTLSFNRTRQAVITRELIEIISGASALSS